MCWAWIRIAESDSGEAIPSWDSVRHLSLILALEERFGFTFDAEEIPTVPPRATGGRHRPARRERVHRAALRRMARHSRAQCLSPAHRHRRNRLLRGIRERIQAPLLDFLDRGGDAMRRQILDLVPTCGMPVSAVLPGRKVAVDSLLADKALCAETGLAPDSGIAYFDYQGTRSPSEWQYRGRGDSPRRQTQPRPPCSLAAGPNQKKT